jgi:hypothetical protein
MAAEETVIPNVADAGGGGAAVADAPAPGSEEEVVVPAEGAEEGGEGGGEERGPGDTSTDDHPEREDIEMDGRKMDARTREALKKFAATDPEAAKAVRDAYYSKQSMMNEFPEAKSLSEVIRTVRTMKATLEAAGGEKGIHELGEKVKDYDREVEQFANGDRALIDQLHEGNPQGVMLAARNCLDVLNEKSPALLEQAMLPSFIHLVKKADLAGHLEMIAKAATEGKGQECYDTAQKISMWLANLDKNAKEILQKKETIDPRTKELDERKQALDKRDADNYDHEINTHVTKLNNEAMSKVCVDLFKQVGLDAKDKGAGRRDFIQGLQNRVFAEMRKDETYMRLAKSIKAKGDAERTAQFAADKFAEFLPDVFEEFKTIRYPNLPTKKSGGKTTAKPAAAAAAANGNAAKPGAATGSSTASVVTKIPAPDTIDWTKTPESMYHVGRGWGEAVLMNGKRVKWQWETATN